VLQIVPSRPSRRIADLVHILMWIKTRNSNLSSLCLMQLGWIIAFALFCLVYIQPKERVEVHALIGSMIEAFRDILSISTPITWKWSRTKGSTSKSSMPPLFLRDCSS
jgi:hypothetical protein